MLTQVTLNIAALDRASYRRQLVEEFLKELPGDDKSVSEYNYFVKTINGHNRIYLKRPTSLNKGVDFEVRVEGTNFRYGVRGKIIFTGNRPSHNDIMNDLANKKAENPLEFKRLETLLDKTYNCQPIAAKEYKGYSFKTGHSVEIIFKSLKWLFIEQDVTYWNRRGRAMLYKGLSTLW